MAKGKYIKPAFMFHPIPLVAGAGTGCGYDTNSTDSNCAVEDPDLGMFLFTTENASCEIQGNPEDFCYTGPMADYNIYSA